MTVTIGTDPHKRSATIEALDPTAKILATGRYSTDNTGYTQMLTAGRQFPDRVWAVEGCNGIGRHLAHRLIHDGETVIDVPAKLSAQVRVFATGNGRITDPVDAYSVALAALCAPNLRQVEADTELIALGMLADPRRTRPFPHRNRVPAAPVTAGVDSRWRQDIPVHPPGPRTDRPDHTSRRGRTGPAASGRGIDRGPGNHRPQNQSRGQRTAAAGHRARVHADGPARDRTILRGKTFGRYR
ncbi:transposase [Nocardia sp. NPDC006630]|uniref:IS110 family transposase n=1 Tax=Nocardia sp. NPDC006630 TaxID=3157181 RepID=UPI0033BE2A5D